MKAKPIKATPVMVIDFFQNMKDSTKNIGGDKLNKFAREEATKLTALLELLNAKLVMGI